MIGRELASRRRGEFGGAVYDRARLAQALVRQHDRGRLQRLRVARAG